MKIYILFLTMFGLSVQLSAQSQAATYIQEAQTYLAAKDYKQAQMSLQDAINDLNNLIAMQISESLPAEINGLKAYGDNSVNTAAMGMLGGGLQITKNYKNAAKQENDADVQIIANSPMLSAINMYMTNPAMMGQGAKSVRVGTRRAILKTEMTDFYKSDNSSVQIRSTELQVPLTQTLITFNLRGFASEADELAFASKFDIEKLRVALGE